MENINRQFKVHAPSGIRKRDLCVHNRGQLIRSNITRDVSIKTGLRTELGQSLETEYNKQLAEYLSVTSPPSKPYCNITDYLHYDLLVYGIMLKIASWKPTFRRKILPPTFPPTNYIVS